MQKTSCALFGFLVASFGFSVAAMAAPVVANNSFEMPAENGGYTTVDPPSWTSSGFANGNPGHGVDSFAGAGLSGGDGAQYFYGDGANPNGEILYQDLNVPFAPNTKYTVNLLGAYRTSCCGGSGITFGLDSDSQTPGVALVGATVGHISLIDEEATPNTFVAASAGPNSNVFTFTTGSVVPTGNIVAYIESDENFAGGGRLNADDFTLSATMVPEPSSIVAILGLCGMGLIGVVRHRRRRQLMSA